MIKFKIKEVPDSMCATCPQLWENECRAFNLAHSEAEQTSRLRYDGQANCMVNPSKYMHGSSAGLN